MRAISLTALKRSLDGEDTQRRSAGSVCSPSRATRAAGRLGATASKSAGQGHEQQNQQDQPSKAATDTGPTSIEPTPTKQNQKDD